MSKSFKHKYKILNKLLWFKIQILLIDYYEKSKWIIAMEKFIQFTMDR